MTTKDEKSSDRQVSNGTRYKLGSIPPLPRDARSKRPKMNLDTVLGQVSDYNIYLVLVHPMKNVP